MRLLTKEILEQFERTGKQDNNPDPIVVAKFFNPCGCQTWLATEYYPEERLFYGYVSLFNTDHENEFKAMSLSIIPCKL